MARLKPIKLHLLLGSVTEWTDEMWDEALMYVLENTSTHDAVTMARLIRADRLPDYLHKVDFLRDFRDYPPTMLLAAYDLQRKQKLR